MVILAMLMLTRRKWQNSDGKRNKTKRADPENKGEDTPLRVHCFCADVMQRWGNDGV